MKKRGRAIITRNGAAAAVLVSPEERETLEVLADKELMRSLSRAEKDERAGRLVCMGKLNKGEAKISRSYGRGEWKPIKNRKTETRRYQSYVRDALQKSSRVNVRISPQDLEGMQPSPLTKIEPVVLS